MSGPRESDILRTFCIYLHTEQHKSHYLQYIRKNTDWLYRNTVHISTRQDLKKSVFFKKILITTLYIFRIKLYVTRSEAYGRFSMRIELFCTIKMVLFYLYRKLIKFLLYHGTIFKIFMFFGSLDHFLNCFHALKRATT